MRRFSWIIVIGSLAVGLGFWLGRTRLLAWYYVHQLTVASAENRDVWMARVLNLEEAAVPTLLAAFSQDDDQACENVALVFGNLVDRWGFDDPRTISLSSRMSNAFATLSAAGQGRALGLEAAWLRKNNFQPPAWLIESVCRDLTQAAKAANAEVRRQALSVATETLKATTTEKLSVPADLLDACRQLTREGLRDATEANRLQAVRLAQQAELGLLAEVVPLLRDSSAAVRREAVLALGPAPEAIADDYLFYWLNDPDADVRTLCELALRGRGLQENHIRLAKLMADRRPAVRLQVIESLQDTPDLDPGVWIRRLSHDPVPAVRAAAAREASNQTQADLSDRIEQMAQNDPSPTVQQVARYYLSCQKHRAVISSAR
jgi:HEAT repeat protein